MNKQEFLTEIGRRLEGFPPEEIERSKEYFLEMIEDRMEDGMSEEEAVADIGTVDEAVADILKDIPLTKVIKAKMKPEGKLRAWEIICLILGSPIWVPLLITAIVLIFVWYIVIWVIVISFFVVDLALFASGLAAVVVGVALRQSFFLHQVMILLLPPDRVVAIHPQQYKIYFFHFPFMNYKQL